MIALCFDVQLMYQSMLDLIKELQLSFYIDANLGRQRTNKAKDRSQETIVALCGDDIVVFESHMPSTISTGTIESCCSDA